MKARMLWFVVLSVTVLALLAGAAGAQGAEPAAVEPLATVASSINYQGRLSDPGGGALSGTYPMRFQVYTASSGGTLLWDSGEISVTVDDGLFNVPLSVTVANYDGQELWVRLYVNGEWLSPRQAILPVPYALSLRPGALIRTATGDAVRGTSTGGYGLVGTTDDGYGVYGIDEGTTAARGYGGYFSSDNGVGVFGYSGASRTTTNMYAPGVYGRSANGAGVYGWGDDYGAIGESTDGRGVYGSSTNSQGVRGYSLTDVGVYGATGGTTTSDSGVYGTGGNGTYAITAAKTGSGAGIALSADNAGSGSAVYGNSASGFGVYASTERADGNYGIYTADNIYSANYHTTGAVMQVVQSVDSEPLETGDVVEIAGLASRGDGQLPVIQVQRARQAGSAALLGVVVSGYDENWLSGPDPTGEDAAVNATAGPVAQGAYLLVAVQGLAQVKVTSSGPIEAGTMLTSAALAAHAGPVEEVAAASAAPAAGTYLGKTLEPFGGGEGLIYVYITLQ